MSRMDGDNSAPASDTDDGVSAVAIFPPLQSRIESSLPMAAITVGLLHAQERLRALRVRLARKSRVAIQRPPRFSPWSDEKMNDKQFLEMFRVAWADFFWLAHSLKRSLQLDVTGRGSPLSVEQQVGICLYRMGHGCSYAVVGHVFKVARGTALAATTKVVDALLECFGKQAIRYPNLGDTEAWDAIERSFFVKQKLPGIVGAIDGTHIPIKKPPNDPWNAYINRKGWSSILFQAVVDGEGNFRNVYGGLAGLIHDNRLFRNSTIGLKFLSSTPVLPAGRYLVGDSGYPISPWCLTPYVNANTEARATFNFAQSSTRMIVEHAFGRLKNRFWVLLSPQAASPAQARDVTMACMVLHNLLNMRGHSLYLQSWDDRTVEEGEYNELPQEAVRTMVGNLRAGQSEMEA